MAARTENDKIAEIRKLKKEYDSKFGPSGETKFSENFGNTSIIDKSNPDSLMENDNSRLY